MTRALMSKVEGFPTSSHDGQLKYLSAIHLTRVLEGFDLNSLGISLFETGVSWFVFLTYHSRFIVGIYTCFSLCCEVAPDLNCILSDAEIWIYPIPAWLRKGRDKIIVFHDRSLLKIKSLEWKAPRMVSSPLPTTLRLLSLLIMLFPFPDTFYDVKFIFSVHLMSFSTKK